MPILFREHTTRHAKFVVHLLVHVPGVPSAPLRLAISNYAHNQTRRAVDRAAPYRGNSFVVVVSSLTCLRFERTFRLFAQAFITSVRLLCEREVPLTHQLPAICLLEMHPEKGSLSLSLRDATFFASEARMPAVARSALAR